MALPMERKRSLRPRNVKDAAAMALCMPRLRSTTTTNHHHHHNHNHNHNHHRVTTPMTLLERFREVVSRLIVLSAITKEPASQPQRGARAGAHDSHHSQAVEDCIEFLKRSAGVAAEAAVEEDVEGVGEVLAEAGDQVMLSAVQVM